jgi:hypothetical protein
VYDILSLSQLSSNICNQQIFVTSNWSSDFVQATRVWNTHTANTLKKMLCYPFLLLIPITSAFAQACTSFNNESSSDWLVTRCNVRSSFVEIPGGFVLNNSIVSRTFRTTCASTLYTESVRSEASGNEKLVASTPEATMLVNGAPVIVGGLGSDIPSAVQLQFNGYRVGSPLERYPFIPGLRGSHVTAWPPAGIRVSMDHTAPCSAFTAGASGVLNATVSYELYDTVAAFGKSVSVSHNCSSGPVLQLLNMSTDLLALASVGSLE